MAGITTVTKSLSGQPSIENVCAWWKEGEACVAARGVGFGSLAGLALEEEEEEGEAP